MSERDVGKSSLGAAFWVAAVAAVALGLGGAWWLAQPDTSVSQYERLAAEIGCQCGTCPNRPILTCGCGFAATMLDELRTEIDRGQPDEQVMAAFASRYSPSIRIKPAARGLDLTAWAAPLLLLTLGAVGLGGAIASWTGNRRSSEGADAPAEADVDDETRDRLRRRVERELDELDG